MGLMPLGFKIYCEIQGRGRLERAGMGGKGAAMAPKFRKIEI